MAAEADPERQRRDWIVVACAEHVRRGVAAGFMQANHGKEAPLRRVHSGDRVAFYSPSEKMRQSDGLQSFTAFGFVAANPRDLRPYPSRARD